MLHSFLTSALDGGKWSTSRPRPLHSRYRSQWPSGLRRSSAAARSMGLRVRIPPRPGMFLVIVLCCQGEVSSSGCLLFQRSPTEYIYICVCVCIYIYIYIYVCVCVCVWSWSLDSEETLTFALWKERIPVADWIGGWVDLRNGLDVLQKRGNRFFYRDSNPEPYIP